MVYNPKLFTFGSPVEAVLELVGSHMPSPGGSCEVTQPWQVTRSLTGLEMCLLGRAVIQLFRGNIPGGGIGND